LDSETASNFENKGKEKIETAEFQELASAGVVIS
jgi:hypothetical protein